jgi:hypothetical protein
LLKIGSPSPILLKIRKELDHNLVKNKELDPDLDFKFSLTMFLCLGVMWSVILLQFMKIFVSLLVRSNAYGACSRYSLWCLHRARLEVLAEGKTWRCLHSTRLEVLARGKALSYLRGARLEVLVRDKA